MIFLRGFDASSVQGVIPFAKLGPEYKFAIFKCYEGNKGGDPHFATNVAGAVAAGITPFAYCFAYPLEQDYRDGVELHPGRCPLEQAKLFVDHAWAVLPGRRLILDMEWPAPQDWAKWGLTAAKISAWMKACCEEVTRRCGGLAPIIYTYPDWWHHVAAGADVSWASNYGFFPASYPMKGTWPAETDKPAMLAPWTDWVFWQFDGDCGLRLPNGVDCDFCVFQGDENDLAALA